MQDLDRCGKCGATAKNCIYKLETYSANSELYWLLLGETGKQFVCYTQGASMIITATFYRPSYK